MMPKKLLLTAVILSILPTLSMARGGGGGGGRAGGDAGEHMVTRTTADQNVAAQDTTGAAPTTYADTAKVVPAGPSSLIDRAKSSFYLGLGATLISDKGFNGLTPKLYAGYGLFIGKARKYYSAVEIYGTPYVLPISPNQNYRVSSLYGASIIPGYRINDWAVLFAKLGVQSTHYHSNNNINSTQTGALFGAGFDIYTTPHWNTRVEYDYAVNKNVNQFNFDFIYKFK